jgi:hypothetical protein
MNILKKGEKKPDMNVLYAREVIMLPLINLWNFMAHNCWALGKNRLLYILFVDAIFCPVTWHHQRRPFVRVLACKTAKTRRGLAGEASPTVKSVKCLKKGEREKEREREREREREWKKILSNSSDTPFYIHVCYMSILPLSSTRLHVDV